MTTADARSGSDRIAANGAAPSSMSNEKRDQAKRRLYIAMRCSEIDHRIKAMAAERVLLSESLKDRAHETGEAIKILRERRTYLAMRLERLRSERKDLMAEKKAVNHGIVVASNET